MSRVNERPAALAFSYRESGAIFHAIVLSGLSVVSYWLIIHILAHTFSLSHDDDLLGGMWAVVATIFVYRYGYEQTIAAALSRMSATVLSFALCFLYLLFLPSNVWGMATLIGIGAVVMVWLRRPDDVITTGITTAVVMVVAAISPDHAWKQAVLRVVDTVVGTGVGIVGTLLTSGSTKRSRSGIPEEASSSGHSRRKSMNALEAK